MSDPVLTYDSRLLEPRWGLKAEGGEPMRVIQQLNILSTIPADITLVVVLQTSVLYGQTEKCTVQRALLIREQRVGRRTPLRER